ncbi:hypothetical protein Dda_9434 [Drechslerella dactyloides]|uniref:Uncharacterized protein n=1 Tax=Drechslerella dactyloides TaxID=74499 RepID=A0AAD6IPC5_DREDA|nr:hypothetical protein Dda_9434 [Drechslerella dactyloides]
MACTPGNRRFSKPTLTAINTTFLDSPTLPRFSPLFSSATISSMASSFSPSPAILRHPSPRRYEALNSPLLKTDILPPCPTPPRRPFSPISPALVLEQTMFDFDISPTEHDSPLSAESVYYCLRQGPEFRQQWSNVSQAPTPPPKTSCPAAPSAAHRAAIRLWESKVSKGTPAPPSPPPPPCPLEHTTSHLASPVEQDIEEFSTQINEIHQQLAHSEFLFKQGMISVYMQQNAAAARLASSPTDTISSGIYMFRPSSVDSVTSMTSFQRRQQVARQRSAESQTRAMMVAQKQEEQRKEFLKITLVDRIEREVAEIERRAIRDMEMVREARYALRIEIERQKARERRRALEYELAMERQRQAALEAQREDEEEAARVLASLNAATEAIAFEQAVLDEYEGEDGMEVYVFHLAADLHPILEPAANSSPSSPSLTDSGSTRPSTSLSEASPTQLSLDRATIQVTQFSQALNSATSLKSSLVGFLASPISPCSPQIQGTFVFPSVRSSLNISSSLAFEPTISDPEAEVGLCENIPGTNGIVAACA